MHKKNCICDVPKQWTRAEEIQLIIEYCTLVPLEDICGRHNRTAFSIIDRMTALNLRGRRSKKNHRALELIAENPDYLRWEEYGNQEGE